MSDDDDTLGRPRRATVKVRRRSLRVPVDEVPRRSSPSLPRVSQPGPAPTAAMAPLPPLEPQRTDPGMTVAELSESDIEVEESREQDALSPPAPIGREEIREEVLVSSEMEAISSPMTTVDDAREGEPSLAELGLDAAAVARANAPEDVPEQEEIAPEATMVTEPLEERTSVTTALPPVAPLASPVPLASPTSAAKSDRPLVARSERPPPATKLSERPPPATRLSERPPAMRPSERPAPSRIASEPPVVVSPEALIPSAAPAEAPPREASPPAAAPAARTERLSGAPTSGVVVARVAVVGTPTPAEPLRVSVEIAKTVAAIEAQRKEENAREEAANAEAFELEVEEERPAEPAEARTSAPPEEVDEEIVADEMVEETEAKRPARPSRPPPPRSIPSMPAAPPPPPAIPSGPPPAPAVSAPPAPPPAPPMAREAPAPPMAREAPAPPMAREVPAPPPAAAAVPPAVPAIPPAPPVPAAAPPPPAAAPAPATAPAAAPPPASVPAEGPPTDPRRGKKKGAWWEDFFNDDYLRTVPSPNPKQVRRQCDFIEQRLGLSAGATVLDVGCGLGLHAVELTRRGYIIVGLDLSLPMLSRAADEAQDQGFKINFLHADMREMSFDSAFDAVLSWGTVFGYFDDEVNKTVLDRMHRALKPGGLLLLDVVNRDYVIRSQPNNVWFEGDGCVVMEETQCNYITSRLHVKRTVMLDDGRQRESAYSVRLYSLHELGQMLHKNFRVVEVSGRESTPGVYFGADSPRTIVVAERRLPAVAPAPPGPPAPPTKRDADQTPPPAPPPTSDH